MISAIITAVGDWLTGMWTFVLDTIEGAISIFYGGDPATLTPIGLLALMGLAIGLVTLGLGFVTRFFKR